MDVELITAIVAGAGLLIGQAYYGYRQRKEMAEKMQQDFGEADGYSSLNLNRINKIEDDIYTLSLKMRLLTGGCPDLMFETDKYGDYIWANKKYLESTGRSMDDMNGTGWILSVHHQDRHLVLNEWKYCIEQGRNYDMEYKMLKRDGTPFAVEAHAYPVRAKDKDIIGWIGVIKPEDK